jgi:hypothetical protein
MVAIEFLRSLKEHRCNRANEHRQYGWRLRQPVPTKCPKRELMLEFVA